MQATHTTRRFDVGHIKHLAVAAGLLASLAIGAAALALADALPLIGGSDTQAVTAPQITSDELYALEAVVGASQVDGWQARLPQVTSDQAFAYEANLELARVIDAQVTTLQLTSDQGWALEASLVEKAAAHQQELKLERIAQEAWVIDQWQMHGGRVDEP